MFRVRSFIAGLLLSTAVADARAAALPQLIPATAERVLEAVRKSGAKVVVVNVWATWCIPCREEFPHLVRLLKTYHDGRVALVLVSADFNDASEAAREFLAEQGVHFPAYIKAQGDQAFIDAFDPQWTGALPATFVYDDSGRRRESFLKPITFEQLQSAVSTLLDAAPPKESK